MTYLYKRQKILTIRERFAYYDANQRLVYNARGLFTIPKRYEITKAGQQRPVIGIRRKFFTFMPKFYLTDFNTNTVLATIRKRFRIGRPFLDIFLANGQRLLIEGSWWLHNFRILDDRGNVLVVVSKKVFAWADTYEIMIDETKIDLNLGAAITIALDCVFHSQN